jgi:hypothetical protein
VAHGTPATSRIVAPDEGARRQTDSLGQARVPREERWHWLYVALPHQELDAGWAWCVDAAGRDAAAGRLDREPQAAVTVILPRSPSARQGSAKPE